MDCYLGNSFVLNTEVCANNITVVCNWSGDDGNGDGGLK
jgi:hypothetical protein